MRVTDLPLDDLISLFAGRRATGTLTVASRRYRKKAFLIDGCLAGVASDNPRDLLGHVLVGWDLISEEQLSEAMHIQERLGTPLGRILERAGTIDTEDLQRALQAQAEEAFLELFLLPVEERRWLENVLPANRPVSLRLPLVELLSEGRRRRERFAGLKERIGGLDVVPTRASGPVPPGLSGRDLHILAEIDGKKDLEGVALACHVVTFVVAELVDRGVRGGYLAIARAGRSASPVQPAALVAEGESALKENDLARAWQALNELRQLPAGQAVALEVGRLQRQLADALALRRISGTAVAVLRSGASAATGLRPSEAFVLSRINGRWNLKEIQRVAPFDELEFGVIIDGLLRRGLIELRQA